MSLEAFDCSGKIAASCIFEPLGYEIIPRGKRRVERSSMLVKVGDHLLPNRDHRIQQQFANLVPDEGILRINDITIAYVILVLERNTMVSETMGSNHALVVGVILV